MPRSSTPGRFKLSKLLRHLAALVLVIVAVWHYIDFTEVWQTLRQVQWPWLGLMLVLATVDRFLMGGKWLQLLRHLGCNVRLLPIVGVYYQAAFLQRFVPSSLSGDALRAILVSRQLGDSSGVLATMVVEKLVAVVAAIFLALLGLVLALARTHDQIFLELLLVLPVLLSLTVGGLYLSLHPRLAGWAIGRMPGQRLRVKLGEIHVQYSSFRSAPRLLFLNFLFSILEQSVQLALIYSAAVALQVDASPIVLVAAITIGQCLRKFAILLEGWLLGEFTMVLVCSLLGIPESQALAFSLMSRVVAMVAELPGALLFSRSAVRMTDVQKPPVVGQDAPDCGTGTA